MSQSHFRILVLRECFEGSTGQSLGSKGSTFHHKKKWAPVL